MNTPKPKISALVITYNEIGYIEKCIEAINFADEIVVVDSYSTDGTYEFLKSHPAVRVIQRTFDNFTNQKSFALRQANYDWILFVDADEVVSKPLENEILQTISSTSPKEAYWFYRTFMFKNKRLRYSGWQTDKNLRLFQKTKVRFTKDRLVHETLEVNGSCGKLHHRLSHFCFKNYRDYKAKMLQYGTLKAQELFKKGKRFSYAHLLLKPTWKFFYNYIVRLGILDLDRGLTICYLNALSVYQRYAMLRKLEHVYGDGKFIKMPTPTELAKAN